MKETAVAGSQYERTEDMVGNTEGEVVGHAVYTMAW